MKHQTYAPHSTTPEFAGVPDVWLQELRAYPEGTPQHTETLVALRELVLEGVVENPNEISGENDDAENSIAIDGFNSVKKLPGTLCVDTKSMRERIKPLARLENSLGLEVTEYVTDVGKRVLVADMRDLMGHKTRKLAPDEPAQKKQLDARFLYDIKILADNKRPRNTVTGVSGVGYTKPPSSTLRGYWLIETNPDGTRDPLVIRLADCASKGDEVALYRQLFDMTLKV